MISAVCYQCPPRDKERCKFDDVGFDELGELCVYDPSQETEPPEDTDTPTPSETPDSEGTATAACQDFESQFPGTPCP